MAIYDGDDLEIGAIVKCSSALSNLDDKTRNRVLKLLLEKFGVIDTSNTFINPNVNTSNHISLQTNLLPSNQTEVNTSVTPNQDDNENEEFPSIFELMTKGFANSESDILLMIIYYKTNFGKEAIERTDLTDAYKEFDIHTSNRTKNLTQTLNRLIKDLCIRQITKTKFSILSPKGFEQVKLISLGQSTSRTKKQVGIKTKKKISLND